MVQPRQGLVVQPRVGCGTRGEDVPAGEMSVLDVCEGSILRDERMQGCRLKG